MMGAEAGVQETFELPSTAILLDSSKSVYMRLSSAANSYPKHISMFIRLGKVGAASEAEEVSELRRGLQKDIIVAMAVEELGIKLHPFQVGANLVHGFPSMGNEYQYQDGLKDYPPLLLLY